MLIRSDVTQHDSHSMPAAEGQHAAALCGTFTDDIKLSRLDGMALPQ